MKLIANGFNTQMPDGWQDRSMNMLIGPTGGNGFAANIVITRQPIPPQTNLQAFIKQQRDDTAAEIPDLEVIDERTTVINGVPAYQLLQRFTRQDRQLQQAQTYILGARMAFVITCTAAIENFNDNIEAFERVVNDFQVL